MAEERFTGVVQWFNNSKGFGFIKPDDDGDDLFVHQSSIKSEGFRTLHEGDRVQFAIALGNDGKTKAVEVTAPDGSPLQPRKGTFAGGRGGSKVGDRRNGAGGAGCYHCSDLGHIARDCNRSNNPGGGVSGGCYNCGEVGHMARDCNRNITSGGGGAVGGGCYACGDLGHRARDCTNSGGGGGASVGACFTCGGSGHMARNCLRGGGDVVVRRDNSCFRCGGIGHMARDCATPKESVGGGIGYGGGGCYNCGEVGHLARECINEGGRHVGVGGGRGRNGGGGNVCFNCGKAGHYSRECVEAASG